MSGTQQWCFGPFRLDPTTESLWRDGILLPLPPKPFAVLAYLVTHAGQVVTKEMLFEAVWPNTAVTEGVLKTCLGQIRQALGDTARTPQYIATLNRRGYRFVAPIAEHTEISPAATAEPPLPTPAMSHHSEGDVRLAVLPPLAAERRHLTVLCCNLVDTTVLARHPDPEEYHEVLRTYHQTCATVMQRFDGYIAQYLGNGVLVYFGYPVAHEDDAQRAIRAGLALIDTLATQPLAVQLGVHTGMVVIEAMDMGSHYAPLAMGETPTMALRLPTLAMPNTLLISAATQRLVAGYFRCKAMGTNALMNPQQPLEVYQVLGTREVSNRLAAAALYGLTPLVGRRQDVALLTERWAHVSEGMGQVVFLTGEAGIGKSRLVQVLIEHVADAGHRWLECQGSPYAQHTAFAPLIELLERVILRCDREEPAPQKFRKLEECVQHYNLSLAEAVPLFAALLSLPVPTTYTPLSLSPQQQKQRTLQTLLTLLLRMAAQQPLLLIIEDLHWVDPSTLEWLNLLIDQGPTSGIFTLCTYRPDFRPPWPGRAHLTQVTLGRLPQSQATLLTQQVAHGKALPPEVVAQIVAKTDGVPLFVEEVTKAMLESDLLQEQDDRYSLSAPLPRLAIPVTLYDSLLARLDRLGPAKRLAQLGATVGREFAYGLLQAVAQWEEEPLQQALHQLVEAELLYQRGLPPLATYIFKHALIQDAAYQSLLKRTRQHYHQRIAEVLVAQFPALLETQPELVARHYTEAGCAEQAIHYWQQAGQHANDRLAYVEAISHCTTGIALLTALPETPERTRYALALHMTLGTALLMTKGQGAPEVEHTYTQARAFCQQMGETPELLPVLFGLWRYYLVRPQLSNAREIGEMLLRLAQRANDPALVVSAHYALGFTWYCLGEFPAAHMHLQEAVARYTPEQRRAPVFRMGQDVGVACHVNAAVPLWLLGYPEQALHCLDKALALAHELAHPYSLVYARCVAVYIYQFCRQVTVVYEQAEAAIRLSTEQGFPLWLAMGTIFRGWAVALQGQLQEGLAQMHQGMAAWRHTGAALQAPYFCGLLADVAARSGRPEDGLQALNEAQALLEQSEERWYEAEFFRLRGVLLLQQPMTPQAEAETWLQRALDTARRQQARSLELRAATSLACLWCQQGKQAAATALLAPIYNWFTEGFDTPDLQEARALLTVLGCEE